LHSAPPRFFDPKVGHPGANGGGSPAHKVGDWSDRTPVLIATREIEKKITDTMHPESIESA
jgi:hypothetical protein